MHRRIISNSNADFSSPVSYRYMSHMDRFGNFSVVPHSASPETGLLTEGGNTWQERTGE